MTPPKQIFQTSSRLRWKTFKWVSRLLLFFLVLMIPVVWIAMGDVNGTFLPGLSRVDYKKLINPPVPKGFNKKKKENITGLKIS
jgi:hypothetical protein